MSTTYLKTMNAWCMPKYWSTELHYDDWSVNWLNCKSVNRMQITITGGLKCITSSFTELHQSKFEYNQVDSLFYLQSDVWHGDWTFMVIVWSYMTLNFFLLRSGVGKQHKLKLRISLHMCCFVAVLSRNFSQGHRGKGGVVGWYCISSIRRLGVNQQIVCCMPGVKRSKGINLNVEFCRRLDRITFTPPGVKWTEVSKMWRASNRGKTVIYIYI